jgi:hypothetical protein
MGAYDWKRDYKVGQIYELKNGVKIQVIRVHENGSMTAEIFDGTYDVLGNRITDSWDSQGWYNDYWTPSEKDIIGDPCEK